VIKPNPKKNLNGIQLDPLAHKNLDSTNSLDLSESGNSFSVSPETNSSKKPKSNYFPLLIFTFNINNMDVC